MGHHIWDTPVSDLTPGYEVCRITDFSIIRSTKLNRNIGTVVGGNLFQPRPGPDQNIGLHLLQTPPPRRSA